MRTHVLTAPLVPRSSRHSGMPRVRSLPQFAAHCNVDRRGKGEHPSVRRALVEVGQSISSRPTTPNDKPDPEVCKALGELFAALNTPGKMPRLDIDRFLTAQVALALAFGDVCDRFSATASFLELSSHQCHCKSSALEHFSCWQRGILVSRGMAASQMVEVLRHATEQVEQKFGQRCSMDGRKHQALDTFRTTTGSNGPQAHPEGQGKGTVLREGEHRNAATLAESMDLNASAGQLKQRLPQGESGRYASHAPKPLPPAAHRYQEDGLPQALSGQRAEGALRERRVDAEAVESRGTRLYSDAAFRRLADHGCHAPEEHAASVPKLTKYLTSIGSSDEQKAWVIFSWVCHHISYDVDGLHGRAKRQSCAPGDVLKSRLSVCAGYAGIFGSLAAHAGLTTEQISGHARNSSRRVGQDVIGEGVGAHAWNAVKLGDEWILIDCTWGAGTCTETAFEATFRPHFFGVPPCQLAFTHFPEAPIWQLQVQPLSYLDFITQPIVCTDAFFGHKLGFVQSSPRGVIKLGRFLEGSLELDAPEDVHVMGRLGDSKAECRRSPRRVALHFSMAASLKTADLDIFVRRGNPYGTYHLACRFVVERW